MLFCGSSRAAEKERKMPRASSEEAADILLDDPEGGTNQGFREAKEVRWRGAAKLGRETSRAAKRHLTKNLPKKLPAECTPVNCNRSPLKQTWSH